MALRAGFERSPREAPKSSLLRGPPRFLRVEKLACLLADVARCRTVAVVNSVRRPCWLERSAAEVGQFFRPLVVQVNTQGRWNESG